MNVLLFQQNYFMSVQVEESRNSRKRRSGGRTRFSSHEKGWQFKSSKPSPFAQTFHSEWRQKLPRPLSFQNEDDFTKTTQKLIDINFQHQDSAQDLSDICQCGRHLYKLNNVKPTLSKSSIYRQSYNKQQPISNVVNHDKEYMKLEGEHIGMNSNYEKDFKPQDGDKVERPKPEDLLKTGGPSPRLTSYNSGFPGYRGDNQYVKPTDREFRGNFPLMSKSTYAKAFAGRSAPKPVKQRISDNLRIGSPWFGRTSYENFYKKPNPEDYSTKVKNIEKRQNNPNFNHQYETTYKNDFIPTTPTVCPAKVKLQAQIKGELGQSKDMFAENSDFKSLSPEYHAISTSKHCYV